MSVRPDKCIECLACVKACHDDAFYNTSQEWKGDVKSIAGLADIMTREWRHLEAETRWIGAPVKYHGQTLVVDEAQMGDASAPDGVSASQKGKARRRSLEGGSSATVAP